MQIADCRMEIADYRLHCRIQIKKSRLQNAGCKLRKPPLGVGRGAKHSLSSKSPRGLMSLKSLKMKPQRPHELRIS